MFTISYFLDGYLKVPNAIWKLLLNLIGMAPVEFKYAEADI